jgi:hypothetical protein
MRRAGFWILVVLLVGGAVGFFAYQRLRKHAVILAAYADRCRGPVTIEENVWQDKQAVVKREHRMEGEGKGTWASEVHRYRAGAQFSVLARGDCEVLSCYIRIDGGQGASKETDSGQVSCTGMVGTR